MSSRLGAAAALCAFLAASAAAEDAPFTLPPATSAPHIEFTADHFDYRESSSLMRLQGHVTVREATWTIRTDQLLVDLSDRRGEAAGFLELDDGVSVVSGNAGTFYFTGSTGTVLGAAAGYAPWRIRSGIGRVDERRRIHFSHAWFTSCNTDPAPHFLFRASSVHVRPKKFLTAWNSVLYVGKVPVFYTPFMWKSLRKKHLLRTRVNPGYDHRNGMFAKSTTQYEPFPYMGGRLYLDYFGTQGPAFGNELEYRRPGVANGGLFGYRIIERKTGRQRWAAAGDHYQAVASSVSFHSRVQAQSDASFNNDYVRAHSLPISPELVNQAALVRRTATTTTRLIYTRLDQGDPSTQRYFKSRESAPRVDWQTTPRPLRTPFLNTFNAFADNVYDHGLGFLQKSVGAGWEATRSIPIVPGVSVTPVAGLSETFQDRFDEYTGVASSRTYVDSFTSRYSMGGTLRVATLAGDWDLGQSYVRRLRPNTLAPNLEANDHGVEKNLLTLQDMFRPTRKVFVRVLSGFDWRTYRDHALGFRERVQPIVGDVVWTPRPFFDVSVHDAYELTRGDQAFAIQADYGERRKRFFGAGVGNNVASANHYFISQEFAWTPEHGRWSAGGVLRQDLRSTRGGLHFDSVQLFDKEMWIGREWHDFYTRFQFRIRPGGVKEAQVRLELRLDKERPLPVNDAPWRQWNDRGEK
ncbi:MAG: LPS-assembly protein LptD [Elusimicrobia bacterium]|nr:LPS-assembly protein LptD [Elusimicrobiota bacterium]